MLCDAHIHFFSPRFFAALAAQRQISAEDATRHLGWTAPDSTEALADSWVAEFDAHGISQGAIIASVPADEDSVADAIARHPSRLIGYCMLDPTSDEAENRVMRALERGLRGVCLFPAMQRYSLHDERVVRVAAMLASFASGPAPPLHPAVPDRKTSAGWSDPGAPAQSDAGPPAAAGDMATARSAAPVLFVHCGVLSVGARRKLGLASPFDMSRGNPLHLHTLALRFPTLPIVIPHFGAGMLREALMLADVCPNVYFDTSSSNSWMRYTPGLTLERVFATALEVVGPARLLFGTDSSFFPRGWHRGVYEQQRAALTRIGASEHDQDQIFGGNFKRLHGGAGT